MDFRTINSLILGYEHFFIIATYNCVIIYIFILDFLCEVIWGHLWSCHWYTWVIIKVVEKYLLKVHKITFCLHKSFGWREIVENWVEVNLTSLQGQLAPKNQFCTKTTTKPFLTMKNLPSSWIVGPTVDCRKSPYGEVPPPPPSYHRTVFNRG